MWDNDKGRHIAVFVKMAHLTYFDKLTIAPQDHPRNDVGPQYCPSHLIPSTLPRCIHAHVSPTRQVVTWPLVPKV
jgi:hypothetical protein